MTIFRKNDLKAWRELLESATRSEMAGDFAKAEETLLEAYVQAKEIYGVDDGNVGLVLLRLAEICDKQGKADLSFQFRTEIQRIVEGYHLTDN